MKKPVIIIGSGIAGLTAALKLAKTELVILITKAEPENSSTRWAQGGIAAVLDPTDNMEAHIEDTLIAGSHHNNRAVVELMVKKGPEMIRQLIEFGVEFEKEAGEISLTKEGGHSKRRIAYKGDTTGKEIEEKLIKAIKRSKNIEVIPNCIAIDLLAEQGSCNGVIVLNDNKLEVLQGRAVVLATGGLGHVYEATTNPNVATGDGFAMGYRAGCEFKDLEFIQFHPTVFVGGFNKRPLLLSEALRGEGAKIVTKSGERFLLEVDERGELASRDIVAKAIYLKSLKEQCYLDISMESEEYLRTRFPFIFKSLKESGLNLAEDLIPIEPAAHFSCGGIVTDLKGKTSLDNLFAFGEVAYTGAHGANRLASNSLLEAMAFSDQIVEAINAETSGKQQVANEQIQDWQIAMAVISKLDVTNLLAEMIKETQTIMQKHAGVIRNIKDLSLAKSQLCNIESKILDLCRGEGAVMDGVEDPNRFKLFVESLNIVQTAILVTEAASKRKESLGCHQLSS